MKNHWSRLLILFWHHVQNGFKSLTWNFDTDLHQTPVQSYLQCVFMLSMYGVVKTFYKGGVSQNFLSLFIQDKKQFSAISCVQCRIIIWNIILRTNLNPLFVLFWRVSQWFRGILNANEVANLLTVAEVKNEFASDILQWKIYSKKLVHC